MPRRKRRAESTESELSQGSSQPRSKKRSHGEHRSRQRLKHRDRNDRRRSTRSRRSQSSRAHTPPVVQSVEQQPSSAGDPPSQTTADGNVTGDTRYVDTQQQFFAEFISVMQGIKDRGNNERDKFPVLNNVIPEFDPFCKEQNIDSWLHKIEECAQIYNWDEKHMIHYALPKLTGVAKTWYQGLPSLLYSWPEWKLKLRESFPSRDNYAELLTEMLGKKVRYGESLELYYYAKMNLLNRCEIMGKRAVDCLIFGIEDRSVRLGAQAAEFNEPEQVLKFFKTVKVGQDRNTPVDIKGRDRDKRMQQGIPNYQPSNNKSNTQQKSNYSHIVCFNCNETGHPFFRCTKPRSQCTLCHLRGHMASECPKKVQSNQNEGKKVLRIESNHSSSMKYKMPLKINDKISDCLVDLGCEGTLIRLSDAQSLGLKWEPVEGPILSGFGNTRFRPLGSASATIEIQGVTERDVEILVVDDTHINTPVMLGHTFTERPNIKITKTETDVIFEKIQRCAPYRCVLNCARDVTIISGKTSAVPVTSAEPYTGRIYVNGTVRGCENMKHYLFPGEYSVDQGSGSILIQNIGLNDITFKAGDLITRAVKLEECLQVLTVAEPLTNESTLNIGDGINDVDKNKLKLLLEEYKDCFSNSLKDLGFTTETEMVIHLEDSEPVVYRPYRLAFTERQHVRDMVQEMLDSGIVRESSSSFASPIVLVNKKSGEKRLCVDYRALNKKTKREHYPSPRIEDQLDLLSGSSLYISLDLASGYYQIPIAEESRDKTAFVTPDGQYEYNRMPFGLVNAPSVFQRTINKIINKSSVRSYVLVYMDDILIPAGSFNEGLLRLQEVLELLKQNGLTLKLSKCKFFYDKIDYLGYEVSSEGVRPGTHKTDAVSKFDAPRNVHEVRRFLGLASYFRRFVKNFALLARPLTALLKKDTPWKWGDDEVRAFEVLKTSLIERPILAIYNPQAETQLHTDASKFGVAGILMQKDETGLLKVIAYYSRQTSIDEQKLHSFELETLAVIASLSKFRVYLLGVKFKIITDCNALRSTLVKRDLIPRIARWWVQFMEFDCEIEYRPGEKMAHVDALSRCPVGRPGDDQHVIDVLTVTTDDWLVTVQQADEEMKNIFNILNDPKTKDVVEIYKNYKLKNGRVFRVIGDNDERWVVPRGARWQILKSNHDDIGHFGVEKTLARIQASYWFPKMRRFVKKYVASCLECAHHKVPSGLKAGELHPIPKVDKPFHTIHADHLGPFIRSKRGNTYILVVIDAFTKFISLFAVRNTKSSTSIRVFKEHFSYFGTPVRLITDQGTSFTSNTFKSFIKSTGIKHIHNAVATPRANGQVERYNRTILAALGSMNHDEPNGKWDEHLPDIQLGINTTINATTKRTPAELLFGCNVTNPSQGILNDIISNSGSESTKESLDKIRSEANELIQSQQQRSKESFDRRRNRNVVFHVGDLVRVIRAAAGIEGQSKKLEPKCQGPYRIKKILPNDRFVIEDTPLTRKGRRYESIVAIDKIFPWLTFSRPMSEDDVSSDAESISVPEDE